METSEFLDQQDLSVCEDSRADLVLSDQLANLAKLESLVKMARMASLDHEEYQDWSEDKELLVTQARWD